MRCRSYPTQISHLSPGETKAQQQPDFPKLSQQLVSWLGLPFPENERHFWFLFFLIYFNWRLITLQYCSGFCHTDQLLHGIQPLLKEQQSLPGQKWPTARAGAMTSPPRVLSLLLSSQTCQSPLHHCQPCIPVNQLPGASRPRRRINPGCHCSHPPRGKRKPSLLLERQTWWQLGRLYLPKLRAPSRIVEGKAAPTSQSNQGSAKLASDEMKDAGDCWQLPTRSLIPLHSSLCLGTSTPKSWTLSLVSAGWD